MATIRAAVFRQPNEPLSIEAVEIDRPHGRETLVRTAASGVCHSDLHFIDGHLSSSAWGSGPAVLGHEGAGVVEEVGDEVTHVQPGDHVVTCISIFCGRCPQCLTGHPNRCTVRTGVGRARGEPPRLSLDGKRIAQLGTLGTFAEKMLVHENALVKIDADVPLDRAALLGCGVLTGVGAALNTARVEPGSTVAVFGCGGVGLSAIQGAYISGARQIIAVDRVGSKEPMAREAGATHFVDSSGDDAVQRIKALTDGAGVDYSFEVVGRPELVRRAVECLATGGTATAVGAQPQGAMLEIPAAAFGGEKRLQFCSMSSNRYRLDIPRYIDFYRQGRLKLDEMVSRRLPLEEVNEAFRAMQAGEVARSVLVFEGVA